MMTFEILEVPNEKEIDGWTVIRNIVLSGSYVWKCYVLLVNKKYTKVYPKMANQTNLVSNWPWGLAQT